MIANISSIAILAIKKDTCPAGGILVAAEELASVTSWSSAKLWHPPLPHLACKFVRTTRLQLHVLALTISWSFDKLTMTQPGVLLAEWGEAGAWKNLQSLSLLGHFDGLHARLPGKPLCHKGVLHCIPVQDRQSGGDHRHVHKSLMASTMILLQLSAAVGQCQEALNTVRLL